MTTYTTIQRFASAELIEKRSRFIGYAKPVATQDEAIAFINEIKSKHWDATHNVYAYVLREGQSSRYSDDGEPQGTAGMPVLNVLIKEGLTDCAVVVTRYFGGIMLGAGGLVRAYSQGSKIAVDAGGVITMARCSVLTVNCDYNFYGRLSSLIPECGGMVLDTAFSDGVTVKMRIPSDMKGQFDAKLVGLSLGKFSSEPVDEVFAPIKC